MDILFWTKLNPNVALQGVTKRFFNRYYYRLELHVNGSSFLRRPDLTLQEQLEMRINMKSVNFGGSWRYTRFKDPSLVELDILNKIGELRPKHPALKFRIEEPNIQVYAEDETELYKFAQAICDPNYPNTHIAAISRPHSDVQLNLLKQGYTIKREESDYPYKVMVREGRYTAETKKQLLNYFTNCGDQVKVPPHLNEALTKSFDSIWGSYFYVKDKSLLTMIAMISPTFIRAVEEYYTDK